MCLVRVCVHACVYVCLRGCVYVCVSVCACACGHRGKIAGGAETPWGTGKHTKQIHAKQRDLHSTLTYSQADSVQRISTDPGLVTQVSSSISSWSHGGEKKSRR